jgi:hypothetical protein
MKENGVVCCERPGCPVLVVARGEFLTPTENDQFLVLMVLFSFIKRMLRFLFIIHMMSALIDERKWWFWLRASGLSCLGGHLCGW